MKQVMTVEEKAAALDRLAELMHKRLDEAIVDLRKADSTISAATAVSAHHTILKILGDAGICTNEELEAYAKPCVMEIMNATIRMIVAEMEEE